MNPFTLDVLQAINDWQIGGNHNAKVKRGNKLKEVSKSLPDIFKRCNIPCYRKEVHDNGRLTQLLGDNSLPETIAAWTTDLSIAQSFKNGVPPKGLQGVIFKHIPSSDEIVINLVDVYNSDDFKTSIELYKSKIKNFERGIGCYGDEQKEVILDLGSIDESKIYVLGGYSSSIYQLAKMYFQATPTKIQYLYFYHLCYYHGVIDQTKWWLTPEGTQNALSRFRTRYSK